jgi:hypothetical protein
VKFDALRISFSEKAGTLRSGLFYWRTELVKKIKDALNKKAEITSIPNLSIFEVELQHVDKTRVKDLVATFDYQAAAAGATALRGDGWHVISSHRLLDNVLIWLKK